MQHPRGRYVKLNIVDYLLIAVLAFLLLSGLVRGVGTAFAGEAETCRAEVEFVIRDLDEATTKILAEQKEPFYLADGSLFAKDFTASIHRTTEIVKDEDGNMTETESLVSYRVTIAFVAEGELAKDGTFLFGGTRRLAMGESLTLTQANVTYTVDVVRVSVSAGD